MIYINYYYCYYYYYYHYYDDDDYYCYYANHVLLAYNPGPARGFG